MGGVHALVHLAAIPAPGLTTNAATFSNNMTSTYNEPRARKWNLWGYIDARDGAQAVRLALEYQATGVDIFIIASADTVMSRPNRELLAEVLPDVPVGGEIGEHDTLLSIDKARRVLGYQPSHSWRDEVQLPG
jgi:nucleoside-diphosphate-sugar epimerase